MVSAPGLRLPGQEEPNITEEMLPLLTEEERKGVKVKYTTFKNMNSAIAEQIWDKDNGSRFLVYNPNKSPNDRMRITDGIRIEDVIYKPQPYDKVLEVGAVLLPSEPIEYDNTERLLREVKQFINHYWEAKNDRYLQLSVNYVFLSWVFDRYDSVPYLHNLGAAGYGKSRHMKTVGGICHKATFVGGALTEAVVFRILDTFQGTLLADEMDFGPKSQVWNAILKILLEGYEKGTPVFRCKDVNGRFKLEPYQVFGTKIINTRKPFFSEALIGRCFENPAIECTRREIPLQLTEEFYVERQNLINKLFYWRLKHWYRVGLDPQAQQILSRHAIDKRSVQIAMPIYSVIDDDEVRQNIINHMVVGERDVIETRQLTRAYRILLSIFVCMSPFIQYPRVGSVTNVYNEGETERKRITPQKCGRIIKKELGLQTETGAGGYKEIKWEAEQLQKLALKYGAIEELCATPYFEAPT